MSQKETGPAGRVNFCNQFKRTINIEESMDKTKYVYNFHSKRGDDLKTRLCKTPENVPRDELKSEIDKHYNKGKVYGSYFAVVASPPNKLKPVESSQGPDVKLTQNKNNQASVKPKQTKSDHTCPDKSVNSKPTTPQSKSNSSTNVRKADNERKRIARTPKISNTLKLNFNYRSSGKRAGDKKEQDDDASDVSSLEELDVTYEGEYPPDGIEGASPDFIKNMFGVRKAPDFVKFIPVPYPVPLQMKKLPLHKSYPQEWNDAQRALEQDQACGAVTSSSDTQVDAKKSASKSGQKLGKLSRLLPKKSEKKRVSITPQLSARGRATSAGPRKTPASSMKTASSKRATSASATSGRNTTSSLTYTTISTPCTANSSRQRSAKSWKSGRKSAWTNDNLPQPVDLSPTLRSYRRPARYPHPKDARFDESMNQLVVEVNIAQTPNFSAQLFIQKPSPPNAELCHVKTEMAVGALLSFFHPYNNVQCYWLGNIGEKFHELVKDRALRPKFTSMPHLRHFEAILVLSVDAGNLLKHRNTCFLHSLSAALDLPPHKILVLARNPCLGHGPATTPK